eukprot:10355012-Lingulodinium_polyedra.AAC.1
MPLLWAPKSGSVTRLQKSDRQRDNRPDGAWRGRNVVQIGSSMLRRVPDAWWDVNPEAEIEMD